MATWNEVRGYLESIGMTQQTANTWTGTVNLSDGRSHTVWVSEIDVDGVESDTLLLHAPFATTSQMSTEEALAQTRNLPYGLGKIDQIFTLKNPVLIQDVDANEVLQPVITMALFADAIEKSIHGEDRI